MSDNQSKTAPQPGHGPSRREFLTRAGLLASGVALMGVPGFRPRLAAAATVDTRAFAASTFALELDGQFIDFLKSTEGGFPKADVIQEPVGPNYIVKKHIGQPKYQDIAIQSDPAMPKPLFDWIASTLTMSHIRKNGAIITADYNRVIQSRLQFNNALITEYRLSRLRRCPQRGSLPHHQVRAGIYDPFGRQGISCSGGWYKVKGMAPIEFPADNSRSRLQQGQQDRSTDG